MSRPSLRLQQSAKAAERSWKLARRTALVVSLVLGALLTKLSGQPYLILACLGGTAMGLKLGARIQERRVRQGNAKGAKSS